MLLRLASSAWRWGPHHSAARPQAEAEPKEEDPKVDLIQRAAEQQLDGELLGLPPRVLVAQVAGEKHVQQLLQQEDGVGHAVARGSTDPLS